MALFKRTDSKLYWLEFTFAGRRYRVSTKTRKITDAREFARQYRNQVYDQVKLGRRRHEPMRFEDAVKRYASTHLKTKARLDKTSRCSAYVLAALTRWVGPDTILDQITTEVVANLKAEIFDEGARKPATVNKYLADLRAILRMAHHEWKRLGELPRFKLYTLKNERTRWLRPEEEVRLLRACADQPHINDLITFLVDTGARMGEACSLTWSDVLLLTRGRGTAMLFATKTQSRRAVPLTERCDALLRRLHAEKPDDQERVPFEV